jgi:S1-C subfamily serine protease
LVIDPSRTPKNAQVYGGATAGASLCQLLARFGRHDPAMRPLLTLFAALVALLPLQSLHAEPTLAPVVRRAAPAVVSIAITGKVAMEQNPLFNDPFFRQFFDIPSGPIEREIQAVGSGVVIDGHAGLIVTNNHVVEHATNITVTLWDGRKLQGRKVGSDPDTDLAVIRVPSHDLDTLPLGNSDNLQVGDYVLAIGNPFGIGQTVTHGIVSALKRRGLGKGYEVFGA